MYTCNFPRWMFSLPQSKTRVLIPTLESLRLDELARGSELVDGPTAARHFVVAQSTKADEETVHYAWKRVRSHIKHREKPNQRSRKSTCSLTVMDLGLTAIQISEIGKLAGPQRTQPLARSLSMSFSDACLTFLYHFKHDWSQSHAADRINSLWVTR